VPAPVRNHVLNKMSATVISEEVFTERLRRHARPDLADLGGEASLRAIGLSQARSLYADRMLVAMATLPKLDEELSSIILDVLTHNPVPLVVAAAAQHVANGPLPPGFAREAQRRLLARWTRRSTPLEAEMATECLAGAFLFACHADASRPALVGALDDASPGEAPIVVARAALLAGLAWQWQRASDLRDLLSRLATDNDAGGQALHELALIRLDEALSAPDAHSLLAGLDDAAAAFGAASAFDPELDEAAAFQVSLIAVLCFCRNAPPAEVEAAIERAIALAAGRRRALEGANLRHWLRPRLDAEIAWSRLTSLLQGLAMRLALRGWLHAVPVLQQLASLRRSLTSLATMEGDRLRAAIDDRLATSFLGAEGLRAQLTEWASDATTDEYDRVEALSLLAHLEATTSAPPGKGEGLAARPTRASPDDVGPVDPRLAAFRALSLAPAFTAKTEAIFAGIEAELAASPDYVDSFRDDCRGLIHHLLVFLSHCLDVAPAAATGLFGFLFDLVTDPLEKELQHALLTMLKLQTVGFPQHQINREVPDVAAGRADIVIIRPAWRIVIEVKRELANASREGIARYLGQAASYTQTGPRVGFLVVLDLVHQKLWPLTIEDNVWVEAVAGDADTAPRYVVVVRIPGRRLAPSSLHTPDRTLLNQ